MLSKLISKKSKYYYRIILSIIFMVIGFIVSVIAIFVSGYYQFDAINKVFTASAQSALTHKEHFIRAETNNFKNYLSAIDSTSEFKKFIQSNDDIYNQQHTTDLMMAISKSIPTIMQFRFINKFGLETIRIDRSSVGSLPFLIDKQYLQNKTGRYYFQEVKELSEDKVWFSKLDLNMEHGQIQKPIVPTLRIAKPYYVNNNFKGMLIINIFMDNILDELMESNLFNIKLLDNHDHILTHNLGSSHENMPEWTHYLKYNKDEHYINEQDEDNFVLNLLFKKQYSVLDLSEIIPNGENLKIIIEQRTDKLIEYTQDILNYMLVMGIIIFLISFPLAIFLSNYPATLHEELQVLKNKLSAKLKILDTYVYASRTDIDGNITDLSKAFAELSGYTKDELIGNKHNLLKSSDTPVSFYKKLWDTILDGKKWTGIVKNIAKDGSAYWLKTHITPELQDDNIIGFTEISQNITDQKNVEEMSIRDELTGAYNRRYFNQVFQKELKRARRNEDIYCIAMLDIDYFKKYNDIYGHIKGDEALQKVVSTISKKLQRPGDYLFRVGGEEFIIMYSDVKSHDEAKKFSTALVKAVEDIKIEHKSSETSNVITISLGLLTITPPCFMDEKAILQRIDELLYKAKDGGRNQLVSQEC